MSAYYSLTTYSILEPGEFVGFDNYANLFKDRVFWISIYNTLYYTVIFVPLSIAFGVCLALLLNLKIRGQGFTEHCFSFLVWYLQSQLQSSGCGCSTRNLVS